MKSTLSWLKEFLDTNANAEEIAYALNTIGFEVEETVDKSKLYTPFIIAEILDSKRHPDAEKLSICTVNNGSENLQIVCGAANARSGIKVVLAPIGALIPGNGLVIKASKIRDVESFGMLCAADELLLEGDAEGIMELAGDAIVGSKFADYANLNEVVFDIDITPNRGDAASVYGIARDLSAKGIGALKALQPPVINYSGISPVKVEILDKDNCYQFVTTYISNIDNSGKRNEYAAQLKNIGSSPKAPLVDISNYAMFSLGRPSHMYDADKIKGKMVIRQSIAGEEFTAIGGQEYQLPAGITVIADDEKILCVAGVIGGESSKVTETTKNTLVEVGEWNPIAVTHAGRALNQHTDSRFRLERRVDHGLTDYFVDHLNSLIVKTCGGKATTPSVLAGNKAQLTTEVKFDFAKIKNFGGVDIAEGTAREILARLGFEWSVDRADMVKVPTWRQGGIDGSEDIVEEILRIYGFDFITSQSTPLVQSEITPMTTDHEKKMRDAMLAVGLHEVVSWSFMDKKISERFGHNNHIVIANPISSELNVMRKTMVPNLISFLKKNAARGNTDIGLFEVGSVYDKDYKDRQLKCLATVRAGKVNPRSVHKNERNVDFYDAKADFFSCVEAYAFDATKLVMSRNVPSYYHPGRAAAFTLGKNLIGYCGEIHPSICKEFDLAGAVVSCELFYTNLPQPKATAKKSKLETSDYQAVNRDFAFIIADSVAAGEFVKSTAAVNSMIESVQVFDVYSGKGVEDGMKSIAVTVRLQPRDKTLSEGEINAVSDDIIKNAEEKFKASLRSSG